MWPEGREYKLWQSREHSLYWKANDDKLDFDNKANLGNANDNYSGGLVFLGLCQAEIKTTTVASRQVLCRFAEFFPGV